MELFYTFNLDRSKGDVYVHTNIRTDITRDFIGSFQNIENKQILYYKLTSLLIIIAIS